MAELASALGELFDRVAPAVKDWGAKLLDNEVSRTGIISGEKSVRKLGPFGDVLVDSVKQWQDKSAQSSGAYTADLLKSMRGKMKSDEAKDFASIWQNFQGTQDPQLKAAVAHGKITRANIYSGLQQAGVKTGPLVQDDWPRMYQRELFEGKNRVDALNRLQKGGMSVRQAESLLDNISGKSAKAYNYEAPRKFDLPGYRRDIGVLLEDADKGYKRLHFAQIFGPNEEKLDLILKGIRESKGIEGQELATRYMDSILKRGKYYRGVTKWEQSLASLQVATKLGTAVLSHLGQPLNLAVYGGLRPMVKALGELASDYVRDGSMASGEDFALRAGSIWGSSFRQYREYYGQEIGSLGSKLLKYTGFADVDRFRRIYSSVVGRHLAGELFDEVRSEGSLGPARTKLSQMGVDVDKALERGFLSEDDILVAAKRTSDITQFTGDANQLPMAWKSNPYARMFMQFKQFFYMQSNFIKDNALKPAIEYAQTGGKSGDLKPLLYLSILFPTFGEAVADLKELVRKGTLKERPEDYSIERFVDNAAHAGAFGIYTDLAYNIASPSDKPIWHFVTGPTISDMVDLARLPSQMHDKYGVNLRPLGMEMLRRVPVVGSQLAYRAQEARRRTRKKPTGLAALPITHEMDKLFNQ
jgi:hypothetical protein